MTYLFEDFPPVSKSEWFAKINNDLKGKPLSDLKWELDVDIEVDPFIHESDRLAGIDLSKFKHSGSWQIGARLERPSNEDLSAILQEGANAPEVILQQTMYLPDFQKLLEHIHLEHIHLHFTIANDQAAKTSLQELDQYLSLQGYTRTDLFGSFINRHGGSSKAWIDLVKEYTTEIPSFRFFQISFERNPSIVETLTNGLQELFKLYQECESAGLDLTFIPGLTIIKIPIFTSVVNTICTLRALRWLIVLLHEQITQNTCTPFLDVNLSKQEYSEDPHHNLIRAATMGLGAVIGGADRICIDPKHQPESAFYQRIARNIQHLLQLESHLDRISDPTAGSLLIDTLTEKLAEKAWNSWIARF